MQGNISQTAHQDHDSAAAQQQTKNLSFISSSRTWYQQLIALAVAILEGKLGRDCATRLLSWLHGHRDSNGDQTTIPELCIIFRNMQMSK